jgi:RHS repeat-associated protein
MPAHAGIQRVENNTDLYYYNSRWYDPMVGRFLQPDTIVPEPGNPQSLNRYTYVQNNPVKYVDPTGHSLQWLFQGYGYGSQVKDNLDSGMSLGDALTTHINTGQILRNAQTGDAAWLASAAVLAGGTYAATTLGPVISAGGSGAAGTAATTAAQTINADGNPTNEWEAASRFVTGTCNYLRQIAVKGAQIHHLVEQRFAKGLGLKVNEMQSVQLSPAQHQGFTNAWRQAIGYRNSLNPINTDAAMWDDVWNAAQRIYAQYPELWELVQQDLLSVKPQ